MIKKYKNKYTDISIWASVNTNEQIIAGEDLHYWNMYSSLHTDICDVGLSLYGSSFRIYFPLIK